MRVLLSTCGSRGDVDPMVGLAVRLRALGVEVRVCAPPDKDRAERLAEVGVPLVPDSDHRVPIRRGQDDPVPRDPRTSDRRGRHDPHRRATVAATLLLDRS